MAKAGSGGEESKGFIRNLGLWDATMLVAGSMIGSGIFIVPAEIARTMGASGWILMVWVLTGAITLCGAAVYGDLARRLPGAGGQYIYLREAYSPLVGFLYGWTLFFVIQTGTVAAVAVGFARFLGVLFPSVSGTSWIIQPLALSNKYAISLSVQQLAAILSIFALTAINSRGIKSGRLVQNLFTSIKIGVMGALILLCFAVGWNREAVAANFSNMWSVDTAVGATDLGFLSGGGWLTAVVVGICLSQVGSLFSSDAWHNVTFAGDEVKQPIQVLPKALAYGTLLVTGLYILANVAYMVVLPIEVIKSVPEDRVATAAVAAIVGQYGALIMAAAIVISTLGANNGLILAGARVYYVMAKDKLFFRSAGELNSNAVPGMSLIAQAIWASFLVLPRIRLRDAEGAERLGADGNPLYGNLYGDLLDYVVFAVLIFYVVSIFGYLRLRKGPVADETPGHYKLFGSLPWIYFAMVAPILISLLIYRPATTWPGLLIVLSGVPVYLYWNRNRTAKS